MEHGNNSSGGAGSLIATTNNETSGQTIADKRQRLCFKRLNSGSALTITDEKRLLMNKQLTTDWRTANGMTERSATANGEPDGWWNEPAVQLIADSEQRCNQRRATDITDKRPANQQITKQRTTRQRQTDQTNRRQRAAVNNGLALNQRQPGKR
jgi:hypothetical protein